MKNQTLADQAAFWFLLIVLILAGPLVGVLLRGDPVGPYLQFPPQTMAVEHPSFSWLAFTGVLLFAAMTTWPFWRRLSAGPWRPVGPGKHASPFPWWGRLALAGLLLFWMLAWTRFSWFEPFQRHTFFPLWFCLIITLNALAFRLSGRCPILDHPLWFTLLFPVSAGFWWVFEYLNRFVNNWYYTGAAELGSWQYFGEATLAFSTVLPAVMSMRQLVLQIPVFARGYRDFPSMPWLQSSVLWCILGLTSVAGLVGTGWSPEWTYPLLWIAPGLLWVSVQKWWGAADPMLDDASKGDLTLVWASAVAALMCGFLWEMWNIYSEAKWIYNVPGVEHFYIFEMPLVGYAGYLPFGVICALVSHSLPGAKITAPAHMSHG